MLNRRAVEFAIRAGLALSCDDSAGRRSSRARTTSIRTCRRATRSRSTSGRSRPAGYVEYETAGAARRVGITRAHIEEDAGKSLHEGFPDSDRATYLDFNRSGVPLIEIVTEPDLRSAADAAEFFSRLRAILVALGVNDGNMEEGSLRCDANVSVRPAGTPTLRHQGRGQEPQLVPLRAEGARVRDRAADRRVVSGGGRVEQETRLWDTAAGRTLVDAQQGRGARLPLLSRAGPAAASSSTRPWIEEIRRGLPELPDARRAPLRRRSTAFPTTTPRS